MKEILNISLDLFQVVRLKLENDRRIVGTLIPSSAMSALTTALEHGSQVEETIF